MLFKFLLVVAASIPLTCLGEGENGAASVEVESDATTIPILKKPHPRVPRNTAVGIKIKNSRSEMVDYYWWSGSEAVYQGRILPRGITATNSYEGHVFYFTPHNKADEEFHRIHVRWDENLYLLPPVDGDEESQALYNENMKELEFMRDYLQRTGRPWLAHYPRDPPILHLWPCDHVGQIHTVLTDETHWKCIPEIAARAQPSESDIAECRESGQLTLEIECLATEPKVFSIKNTVSDAEAELIKKLAQPKIRRSMAGSLGGLVTTTRTSENAWLGRKEHFVMDTIYRRAADMLNISETLLTPGRNVEQLQVVHYDIGQEYANHHDFGADGRPQQRAITLLFYLNEQASPNAGGETAFPKANGGEGIKVHPGKGNSALFYSLLEDGNADDLSLHAALPVKEGEKWIANFWVWDPHR